MLMLRIGIRLALAGSLATILAGCDLIRLATAPEPTLCAEYQVLDTDGGEVGPEALDLTRDILASRANAFGIVEPQARSLEPDGILVSLSGLEPGDAEAQELRGLLGATGTLEFIPIPAELAGEVFDGQPLPEGMAGIEPILTGEDVAVARPAQGSFDEPAVDLQFTEAGAIALDEYAAGHFGERFAIVLDGVVQMAPSVNSDDFGGQVTIVGSLTDEEVNRLVTVLHFGSLPLDLREVSFGACP